MFAMRPDLSDHFHNPSRLSTLSLLPLTSRAVVLDIAVFQLATKQAHKSMRLTINGSLELKTVARKALKLFAKPCILRVAIVGVFCRF